MARVDAVIVMPAMVVPTLAAPAIAATAVMANFYLQKREGPLSRPLG